MFGRSAEEAKLQKAMRQMGADSIRIKNWFRSLEKMKKSVDTVQGSYERALASTQELVEILETMEKALKEASGSLQGDQIKILADCQKRMGRLKGACDHSFVISADDKEFHLTFEMLLKLSPGDTADAEETIILQSEVENLLALAREGLGREHPRLLDLCYFYVNRTDRELEKLPPSERIEKIQRVCRKEFVEEMRTLLADCIAAAYREREETGKTDKGVALLLAKENEGERGTYPAGSWEDFKRQADLYLSTLCSFGEFGDFMN